MKILKRVAVILLVLCMLVPFAACQNNPNSGKTLVMVFVSPDSEEYVPLIEYYADHNKGLDMDLLQYFAEQNGMTFKTKSCETREEVLEYISTHSNNNDKGRIYIGAGGLRTPETGGIDSDKVSYSDVYVSADVVALAKKGSGLTKDLSGYKVDAQKVSFGYGYVERGAYGDTITFPKGIMSAIKGVNDVVNGAIDAFVLQRSSAEVYLADSRYADLEIIEGSEIKEDFVFAVEKDNQEVLDFINGCISTWRADPNAYGAIVEVYSATKNIGSAEEE